MHVTVTAGAPTYHTLQSGHTWSAVAQTPFQSFMLHINSYRLRDGSGLASESTCTTVKDGINPD